MKNNPFHSYSKLALIAFIFLSLSSCNKSDSDSYTITIGVYSKDSSGNYVFTGKELLFNSTDECQTWSRTASGDSHSANSHLHYNAATDVSFDSNSTTFSWTEYGPELDQGSAESICASGNNGVSKTVNNSSYYQDKPNVFLKITSAEKI